jgi:hypothetical protein
MDTTTNQWRSIAAMAEIVNRGATKPTLTEHALRHYVRTAEQNGLEPHIRRLGRKILIHEQGFLSWLAGEGRRDAA